jgi:hypothetical protein
MQPRLRRGHASPGGSGYGGLAWPPASHSDLKGLPHEIRGYCNYEVTKTVESFLRLNSHLYFYKIVLNLLPKCWPLFLQILHDPAKNLYLGSQSLQKTFYLNSGHLSAHLLPLLGQPLGNAQHFPVTRGKIKRSALPFKKRPSYTFKKCKHAIRMACEHTFI